LGERPGRGTAALRRPPPFEALDEQTERAIVARLGEPAVRVLADHVGVRLACRGGAQQLAGARRAGLAEREAGLGLDEVASVTLVNELAERCAGHLIVHEFAERPGDRAPRAWIDLAVEPL